MANSVATNMKLALGKKIQDAKGAGLKEFPTDEQISIEGHADQVLANIENLRLGGNFTDLTIAIDDKQFPCHKVVLAAGSIYFNRMFASGMEESFQNVIQLKQIEPSVFELVLQFLYTGMVDIQVATVLELFAQANLFLISRLQELCVSFLEGCLDETNCLAVLASADAYQRHSLFDLAKTFACFCFPAVVETEDFQNLSVQCITSLLQDSRLKCQKEEQVFEAALRWLDNERNKQHEHKVLECIRFPLLNRSYLMEKKASIEYLNTEKGRELLDLAAMYHSAPTRRYMLPSHQITPRLSFPYFECALLFGGRCENGVKSDVLCYQEYSHEIAALKPLPFKKTNEFAVCAVRDEIFVTGGMCSARFWKYDLSFGTWIQGVDMNIARRRHVMAAVDDNVYVFGGFDEKLVLDSIEVWERATNEWTECATLAKAMQNLGGVAYGSQIYIFGGTTREGVPSNLVQCFDTMTNTCTLCTATLPAKDTCVNAAVLNSHIYVLGLEGFTRFFPAEDRCEKLKYVSVARDFASLCVLDEKLYAFGGRRRKAEKKIYSNNIDVYDPARGMWFSIKSLPEFMYYYGCVRVCLTKPSISKQSVSEGSDGTVRN